MELECFYQTLLGTVVSDGHDGVDRNDACFIKTSTLFYSGMGCIDVDRYWFKSLE